MSIGGKKGGISQGEFLEPLSSKVKRTRFAIVDIESKDGDSQRPGFTRPFLIGVYDSERREYVEFRDEPHLLTRDWTERAVLPGGCIDKTMSYLMSPLFKNYNIYAHNGGSFDHLFWLEWLRRHQDEYGFEVVPVQSSIQVIKVWMQPQDEETEVRQHAAFLDSMKLLPMGLDRACQTFGLPGKVSHDLGMHEDDPQWSVYLKQDCLALAEVLLKTHDLVENRLGGEIGMTAPSTSMKLFRRKFLARKDSVKRIPRYAHWTGCKDKENCTGCAHEWIRRGYYGGRTELFRTHGEGLHYYDINSSYVAAMKETMPVGNRYVEEGRLDWRLYERNCGFVECMVHVPEDCPIPPLPFRHPLTHKLMFPSGTFHGVWSTEELKLLEDPMVKGEILDVRKSVWFGRKNVFGGMVDELWRLRDKSQEDYDEGLSMLAKLMGNSLYGKFGMKTERTSVVFRKEFTGKTCFLCGAPVEGIRLCPACHGSKSASGDSSDWVWYQKKKVEASYIIPQIAAHITALARVRIWRFMKQAIEAGGNIYYTDTDSIITDAVLKSSTELGALKDEYPGQLLRGEFIQPKVYMLEADSFTEAKVTMKGFPKKLRTKENLERLKNKETLDYINLERVRTLARKGFTAGPQMRNVKKSFKSDYDKRVINPDGLTTRSVVMNEPWSDFTGAAAEE